MNTVKGFLSKRWWHGIVLAALTALISFPINWKQEQRIDNNTLLKNMQEQLDAMRVENERCRKFEIDYNNRVASLQAKIIMLESATMNLPLPMYLKTVGTEGSPGTMLAVNEAYERMYLMPFGKNAADYIGKTDVEFWGEKLGTFYWLNDLTVVQTGEIFDDDSISPFKGKDGDRKKVRVIKYPRYFGASMIGIAGIIIPERKIK